MIFAHGDQALPRRIDGEVRVAQCRRRCQRVTAAVAWLAVHALVGEVGEEHRAAGDRVSAAAVFMDARADVEAGRGDIAVHAVGAATHQHAAAAFRGTLLQPVAVESVEARFAEADGVGCDQAGADGGGPGTVRGGGHFCL